MKRITSLLALSAVALLINNNVFAQTIELQFNKSSYNGGYNISCNGATDGSVTMIVIGGTSPYTYQWSNGATTKDISNLAAGTYDVTVTDDNSVTATGSVTLLQPAALGKTLTPSAYGGGYNISIYGLDNGSINLSVSGGTPPYTFLWSNAATTEDIANLTSGNYSVTITDMNNCTTTGSITLTQPSQLVITSITSPTNAGGFNISCHGGSDGSITVTATGGVPNYSYRWDHGPTGNPLNEQRAGTYTVIVTDRNNASATASITLTQPNPIEAQLTPSLYNNDYNISCHNCANGFINSNVTGGITPYSYEWRYRENIISTSANINNLDAGTYSLILVDALGCRPNRDIVAIELIAPDRDDWSMQGNAGTNPNTDYIGTSDSTDFVLRTNGIERLKTSADGLFVFKEFINSDGGILLVDSLGVLRKADPAQPHIPCFYWSTCGNTIYDNIHFIGSLNNASLKFRTNDIERMILTTDGDLGIGTSTPDEKLQINHDDVSGGILLNRVNSGTEQKSEIKFAYNGTVKMAAGYDLQNNGSHSFFVWDHLANSGAGASRFYINSNGQVGIGYEPPANAPSLYKLWVEGAIKVREIKVTATNFPDYVFEDDYNLMSIKEYGEFIKSNRHLPGIKTAKEIEEDGGFEVGELSIKLLEKIEEQALYIIDMQKQIDELKKQIKK